MCGASKITRGQRPTKIGKKAKTRIDIVYLAAKISFSFIRADFTTNPLANQFAAG
jgi:hypothetical protein